jgi:hypothetical protein
MEEKMVICSFYNRCKNYNIKCKNCKWNASLNMEDHLLIETKDGRTVRFL